MCVGGPLTRSPRLPALDSAAPCRSLCAPQGTWQSSRRSAGEKQAGECSAGAVMKVRDVAVGLSNAFALWV